MSLARILIVEDEVIVAQGLHHTLTHLGYDVLAIATSGRKAMDRVEELRPDLVLMDIRLKGEMDGIEAAEQIRSRFDLPIVYLTAHADDETLNRAKPTEPSGYLLKPLSTDVLRSTLEMALYKYRAETRLRESEEILKRRATQLALLNDVGSQIAATLEKDEIMGKAVHLIHETFDYHHVALFILDGERDEMVMRARAGDFDHLFPAEHRVGLDRGLVGWTARQGQTAVANDVTADPRYVNFYPDLIPSSAELCAPIWVADSVVGVLDVQSPQRDAFDENDARVMETLATQVAVALQNARLHDQV